MRLDELNWELSGNRAWTIAKVTLPGNRHISIHHNLEDSPWGDCYDIWVYDLAGYCAEERRLISPLIAQCVLYELLGDIALHGPRCYSQFVGGER